MRTKKVAHQMEPIATSPTIRIIPTAARLKWIPAKSAFEFQKDQEFVGGFTRVFHVYGNCCNDF